MRDPEFETRLRQLETQHEEDKRKYAKLVKRIDALEEAVDILAGYCRALKAQSRGVATSAESVVVLSPPAEPVRADCAVCSGTRHVFKDGAAVLCECEQKYRADYESYKVAVGLWIKHQATEERRRRRDLKLLEKKDANVL